MSCGAVVILASGCEVDKLAVCADVVVWKEVEKKMVMFSGRLSREGRCIYIIHIIYLLLL